MALSALVVVGITDSADAGASNPTFQCVVVNVDTCTVTIPLTSNMNEQVGSSMPDSMPWTMSEANGQGPYGLTGPGNPQTTWNGVGGALQGTVWSAILTTGPGEPAGSQAVLTFTHVTGSTTTTLPGVPYSLITYSYPFRVVDGSLATVTASIRPIPAKGHVILLRKSGATWTKVGSFAYSAASKKWSIKFKWRFPARASETFRVEATAAPGLTTTFGGNFKIATLR
jgi:hypothetical protein